MADLRIGALADSPETPVDLLSHRFNRHTFWCGQSGSGKTYALGVLLEQLLVHTSLPMVIFDPNADFTRINEVSPGDPHSQVLESRDIRILRPGGVDPLFARFVGLSIQSKAALLQIDPLIDRDEYNTMLHLEELFNLDDPRGIGGQLRDSDDATIRALALRIENLGILNWDIWAFDRPAATDVIESRPDATVLDLSGFSQAEEALVLALSVLEDLWARREQRRPVLLVIDEAHNLCSPDLSSPLAKAVREQIIRIAAEGRKYGLWLLLSTQRPSKIHPSILSACDNLALMKMSSPIDLDELGRVFGFAPAELLAHSPHFSQGQALFAGGFIAAPSIVQVRNRITAEGGKDVVVPLR